MITVRVIKDEKVEFCQGYNVREIGFTAIYTSEGWMIGLFPGVDMAEFMGQGAAHAMPGVCVLVPDQAVVEVEAPSSYVRYRIAGAELYMERDGVEMRVITAEKPAPGPVKHQDDKDVPFGYIYRSDN